MGQEGEGMEVWREAKGTNAERGRSKSSRARDGCSNACKENVCIGFSMPTPEASKDGYAFERGKPRNISQM